MPNYDEQLVRDTAQHMLKSVELFTQVPQWGALAQATDKSKFFVEVVLEVSVGDIEHFAKHFRPNLKIQVDTPPVEA